MITLSDVQDALDEKKLKYPHDRVRETLAAEKAHQRSVLDIPSPRPEEVDQALLERVLHNLRTTKDEPTLRRVGHTSRDVQRLERPYRLRRPSVEADFEPVVLPPHEEPTPELGEGPNLPPPEDEQ